MKKDVRLYNMIMPLWLVLAFPVMWLPTLAGNFIIDSIVLLILLKIKKKENKKDIWKGCILKVWAFGMLADIIGGAVLVAISIFLEKIRRYEASNAIIFNPWANPLSAVSVLFCMALSSVLIYLFDKKISFKKVFDDESDRRCFALAFAVITTPWLFASSIVIQ